MSLQATEELEVTPGLPKMDGRGRLVMDERTTSLYEMKALTKRHFPGAKETEIVLCPMLDGRYFDIALFRQRFNADGFVRHGDGHLGSGIHPQPSLELLTRMAQAVPGQNLRRVYVCWLNGQWSIDFRP